MISQLLVAIDRGPGSRRVVEPAASLAQRLGAQFLLWSAVFDERHLEEMDAYLRTVLSETVAPLAGLQADVAVVWSHDPAASIVEFTAAHPATLAVLSSHARGPVREAVLGSVSAGVVGRSRTPVLLVGPACAVANMACPARVVACLDGTKRSETTLPAAAAFAKSAQAPLAVVHVAERAEDRDRAAAYVESVARDYAGASAVALAGDAADQILGVVTQVAATVVAVGTHRTDSTGRSVLGRVATSVLRHAPGPVLVVPSAE